jgi:hypothetical protein
MDDEKGSQRILLVTLFDSGYAARAKVALESSGVPEADTYLLALDDRVKLMPFTAKRKTLRTADISPPDSDLALTLSKRSWPEQIFTLGPLLARTSLESNGDCDWIVYADADIYFHQPLDQYLADYSEFDAVIAPHRHYPWNRIRLRKYGEFNVGVVAFRNTLDGRRLLEWWADSCIRHCSEIADGATYADQKYLEAFSILAENVFIDSSPGANFAPWNSMFSRISRTKDGALSVDGDVLKYSHMQGLKRFRSGWALGYMQYFALASEAIKKNIYLPYLVQLELASRALGDAKQTSARKSPSRIARVFQRLSLIVAVLLGQFITQKQIERYQSHDSNQRP